jgi:hypothetical protein
MLSGFKVFHHRSDPGPAPKSREDATREPNHGDEHSSRNWSRHPLEERRSKRRDECFRGLVELEEELVHEVERDA